MIINYLALVLASPAAGNLRQPLPNLSHRLILAPRKDFLPSEKVAIGEALWPEEKKAAKERERTNLKGGGKFG